MMLEKTFLHIPGISKNKEKEIWSNGISGWEDIKDMKYRKHILSSIQAFNNKDYKFFIDRLPSNEHWRAYKHMKCAFLDIETTGLSRFRNDITVIGVYDGAESKIFVNGQNMDEFNDEIKKYDMIVSFNGKCFDVPFIREKFGISLDVPHLDLRYIMRAIGYSGGLKRIEKEVGIIRDDDLAEVDGFEAVRLWKRYKRGDNSALDLLIRYNKADIENLKVLMDFAYDKMVERLS